MSHNEQDKDKLLDHEYDGIRELDNHMPRWWILGFYFTIAFSVVYIIYYHFAGGPSSAQEYEAEMAAAPKRTTPETDTTGGSGITLLTDAESLKAGEALYIAQACIGCHKPDLGGSVGPNLTDDYWIHGCKPEEVAASIKSGFPEKGMTPYGNNQPLSAEKMQQLVSYIFSKKGSKPVGAKPIDPAREKLCKS